MIIVTNQLLYSLVFDNCSGKMLTENSAEQAYAATLDALSTQSEFSDELRDKCASIVFDAVNEYYLNTQGIPSQSNYSDGNIEELFTAESEQDLYALFGIRRRIVGAAKGLAAAASSDHAKNAFKGNGAERMWKLSGGKSIYGVENIGKRFRIAYKGHLWDKVREDNDRHNSMKYGAPDRPNKRGFIKEKLAGYFDKRKKAKAAKEAAEAAKKKGFFGKFKDNNGKFLGIGKGGDGVVKWAKNNKAQAATAATVAAGAGYLTYRAIKNRNKNQTPQSTTTIQHNPQQSQNLVVK